MRQTIRTKIPVKIITLMTLNHQNPKFPREWAPPEFFGIKIQEESNDVRLSLKNVTL